MTNTNVDVDHIIDNPVEHGFTWGYGPLVKNGVKVADRAPYMEHRDRVLIEQTFGDDYFIELANTRSGRVRDQTLRDDIYDNRALAKNEREMKRIVIERALGNKRARKRVVVEVERFVANDGSVHNSLADAIARNQQLAAANVNA